MNLPYQEHALSDEVVWKEATPSCGVENVEKVLWGKGAVWV